MSALEEIKKKDSNTRTLIETMIWLAHMKNDSIATPAAAELADLMASMEIYRETLRRTEVESERRRVALADKIEECASKDEALRLWNELYTEVMVQTSRGCTGANFTRTNEIHLAITFIAKLRP